MSDGFDFDFKSSKTTHKFLRKGQGKRMSNRFEGMNREFLKKGEGKLGFRIITVKQILQKKRQRTVIDEQFDREEQFRNTDESKNNKK